MTKIDATKRDVFLHKRLRTLMEIYLPMKICNEQIRNRANISIVSQKIYQWRWSWFIGYILRMNANHIRRLL